MPINHTAAENFVWSAARLVDRYRYSLLFTDGPSEPVLEALRAYRNPDGGFGHGLEPDLRCPGSHPSNDDVRAGDPQRGPRRGRRDGPRCTALHRVDCGRRWGRPDAVPEEQRARDAVASLGSRVDVEAVAPSGGIEGEALRALELSPRPGSRSRGLFTEAQIQAHLDVVEAEQQDDGGWMFDWRAWAPAQTTDWQGNVTIRALGWLRDNGRAG